MAIIDLKQTCPLPARILAVKLSSFGDIVHVTGALRALRRAFPQAELILAVEQRWADIVRHNPNLDGLIESSVQERLSLPYLAEIRRHLSGRKFDVVFDFQGTRRSAAWVYLSGARFKLGRGNFRPGWQFNMAPDPRRHAVVVCAEICRAVGVAVDSLEPEIHTSPIDEQRLDELLDHESIPRSRFILLNPFSRWISKDWPADSAAALIQKLSQHVNQPLILTGGRGELSRAEALLRRLAPGTVTSLLGRLPLGQSLCLFRRARLMVSCDSGPMHAAAAFGVPVVALFGPTLPERTGPWGPNHCVLQSMRPPTHQAYRNDTECIYMRALDSGAIWEAISARLNAEGAHQRTRAE